MRSEIMTSPDFWKLLSKLSRNLKSAAKVFEILESGTSGNPPAIMADNYEAAVILLDGFASAADPRLLTDAEPGPRRPEQQKKLKKYVNPPLVLALSPGLLTLIQGRPSGFQSLQGYQHLA